MASSLQLTRSTRLRLAHQDCRMDRMSKEKVSHATAQRRKVTAGQRGKDWQTVRDLLRGQPLPWPAKRPGAVLAQFYPAMFVRNAYFQEMARVLTEETE